MRHLLYEHDFIIARLRQVGVGGAIGFVVPHGDARDFAQVAALGERHGWDGVFTWEAVWGVHAWATLGAASMVTERIRLGTSARPDPMKAQARAARAHPAQVEPAADGRVPQRAPVLIGPRPGPGS